ncbi:MAG TPA: glycosyltransferase 87 family protein, partial [Thermoanaerobaculia bacterium]|nr:glycosyltransferase 87 family protein [Thermoanaerobaculia bacterium]
MLTVAGLALFLAKLALAPLWSWDHFAVWGLKSRRLLSGGVLDLGFLDLSLFRPTEPHYPLGLPFAWRLLSLGALPGDLTFKVTHALLGLALTAVTRQGLLLVSRSRRIANALTAWLAVSPLFWDTVGLGHADLALALWAITSCVLLLEGIAPGRERERTGILALAGIAAGFLPWLKQEGLLFALALLA